jgi:4-hydroxybenzoate polyprenyltransferase
VSFLINQYSFVIISLLLIIAAGFFLLRHQPTLKHYLILGVIVIGAIAAWMIIRPRQTPLIKNADSIKALIGAGKPVLLEFQSPY